TNDGTINWLNDGQVWFGFGARLTNNGLFSAQGTANLTYNNAGNAVSFDNGPTGTLRKLGATTNHFGSEYGGVTLNNWGTLDAQEGVLLLDQSQKTLHSGGTISGDARIKNGSGTVILAGGTALNGTFELAGGALAGAGGFSGNGVLDWSGGQITGASVTNEALLTTIISPGPSKSLNNGSIFQQNGATIVTASGNIYFSNGARFNNAGLFEIRTNADFYYDNAGPQPTFNNQPGGIVRNATTNTAIFDSIYGGTIFNNSGQVDAASGVIQFGGGGSSSGEFAAAAGARIEFTGQTQTLQNGASFTGDGVSKIVGGRVNLNNTGGGGVTVNGTLELVNNSFLGGTGQFLGTGALNWKGGTLDGAVTMAAGATMNVAGPDAKYLYGRVSNLGTLNWLNDGWIWCALGGGVTNAGLFHAQGTGSLTYNHAGAYPTFDNGPTGILRKSGATTNRFGSEYGGVTLNNYGAIDVQAGTLLLEQAQKTLYPGGTITGAARLKNNYGVLNLSGATALNGTLELAGGTLSGSGAFNGTGALDWSGGNISGAQFTNSPGLTLFISPGTTKWLGNFSVVQQNGSTIVNEPGNVTLSGGAIFNNAGVFDLRTNTTFLYDYAGAYPSFNNLIAGVLRKSGSGNAAFSGSYGGIQFHNSGMIDLLSGTLAMDGANDNASSAVLRIALASSNSYPKETFAGSFGRNGALTIALTNGFVPADGMSFSIATHASATGEFLPVNLPSLPFPLQWKLAYTATATTLSVERAHVLAAP
ncbi:MAG: beta strand repeat-containing protein, partial [Verrucomicrobiota bacterium]